MTTPRGRGTNTDPRPPTRMSDAHWNHDVEKAGNNRYCRTCQRWVGR